VEVPLDTSKPDFIMMGHRGEIWALAVHPKLPYILTGAHDCFARLWDYSKKTFVPGKFIKCKEYIRSAAFHPSGSSFALGLNNGRVGIYDFETFENKHSKKYRGELIDCLQYSPDGKILAAGSWDQMADLINTETFAVLFTLKGHSSSVQHLNFSQDSKFVMTNSKDYEILYWNVATGKRVSESTVVDLDWGSWNCVLGWPVVGVFKADDDGTDVNSCSISGELKADYRVIATGDDSQNVCLFRYPAMSQKCPFKTFSGHASHVTRVRFSPDNTLLFSTGGLDDSIFQWKHHQAHEPKSQDD